MSKVKLLSSDHQTFEVEEEVASESQTVKNLIEETGADETIPLPNVSGKILARVVEYCKFHVEANKKTDDKPAKSEDDIKVWAHAVSMQPSQRTLLASNYAERTSEAVAWKGISLQALRCMLCHGTLGLNLHLLDGVFCINCSPGMRSL